MALVVLVGVGCGGSSTASDPEPLVFERYSPPQSTSHDVFVAARGDIVVLATRISLDAGVTWQGSPLGSLERVAIDGTTLATFTAGLVRYDVSTKVMTPVAGAPAYTTARTWRITPQGRFVVFDPLHNAIASETASGFTTATLPQPTPTEFDPYITDLESNGSTLLAVSAWGIYRSIDGTTWERVMPQASAMGRELVALADKRFVLLGGAMTYRFDAQGDALTQTAGVTVETQEALACDDGGLVARGNVSRDAATSWQPLIDGGALTLTVERVGCGGGRYWVLGHSAAWGYRLLRYDGAQGSVMGNWEHGMAWTNDGPPILRTADGTFIAAGLAWRDGDAGWTLREVPSRTWAAGETLFGIADGKFFASDTGGRTWRAAAAMGLETAEVEAFARSPDGGLHASRFTGKSTAAQDTWDSTVWRSTDGTTWAKVYDARAAREPGKNTVGEVHRFVGITGAGAWIATDAISNDAGATWQPTEYDGDKSLAFVTPDGYLVTPLGDLWHVFEAGGLGDLVGTWALEVDGQPLPASQLRSVTFDEAGYAYVARGTPYVRVWRSKQPVRAAPGT